MPFKPGILASALIVLGALLFLLSYFWTGYRDRQTWTEDRAKSWTEASVALHNLHGLESHRGAKSDSKALADLDNAKAKFEALQKQKDNALNSSRWWATLLWGAGITLMIAGIGVYGGMALGGSES